MSALGAKPRNGPKRRGTRARRPAALLAALGAFLVICGVLLVWMAPGSSAAEDEVALDRDRAMRALEATQRAEHALEEANYGEARAHLQDARQTLARLLHEAKEESADGE